MQIPYHMSGSSKVSPQTHRVTSPSPLLLHVLDQSRSGLSGLTRAGADAIASERAALTLIDATAMRTAPDCLRWDLEVGRIVLIAGSTFLGGHASSAAVLVPPSLAARMTHAVPAHLVAEASAHDMALEWRDLFCDEGAPRLNIGLGLRWSAALAELDRYLLTPLPLREAILDAGLPGSDVFGVCRALKNPYSGAPATVIFITSKSDPEEVVSGLASGGVDYLVRPFREKEVLARVRVHLRNRLRLVRPGNHPVQVDR